MRISKISISLWKMFENWSKNISCHHRCVSQHDKMTSWSLYLYTRHYDVIVIILWVEDVMRSSKLENNLTLTSWKLHLRWPEWPWVPRPLIHVLRPRDDESGLTPPPWPHVTCAGHNDQCKQYPAWFTSTRVNNISIHRYHSRPVLIRISVRSARDI